MTELIVVEKVAEWQRLKALVLDSVSSPITRRVYNMALDEYRVVTARRRQALPPEYGFDAAGFDALVLWDRDDFFATHASPTSPTITQRRRLRRRA